MNNSNDFDHPEIRPKMFVPLVSKQRVWIGGFTPSLYGYIIAWLKLFLFFSDNKWLWCWWYINPYYLIHIINVQLIL